MYIRALFFFAFFFVASFLLRATPVRLKLPCGEQDVLNPYSITVFRKAKEVLHTSAYEFELKPGTYRLQVRLSAQQQLDTLLNVKATESLELDLSAHPLFSFSPNFLYRMLTADSGLRISCLTLRCHGGPLLYTGKLKYNAAEKRMSGLLTDTETRSKYTMRITTEELIRCFAGNRDADPSFSSGSYILLRSEENTVLGRSCFPALFPVE